MYFTIMSRTELTLIILSRGSPPIDRAIGEVLAKATLIVAECAVIGVSDPPEGHRPRVGFVCRPKGVPTARHRQRVEAECVKLGTLTRSGPVAAYKILTLVGTTSSPLNTLRSSGCRILRDPDGQYLAIEPFQRACTIDDPRHSGRDSKAALQKPSDTQ